MTVCISSLEVPALPEENLSTGCSTLFAGCPVPLPVYMCMYIYILFSGRTTSAVDVWSSVGTTLISTGCSVVCVSIGNEFG